MALTGKDGIKIKCSTTTNINGQTVRLWLNGPGAPVFNWREVAANTALATALAIAPVNNPLNAKHRGGVVGTYKAGIRMYRTGNQYGLGFNISATARHSRFVELGRRGSSKKQRFSWSKHSPPGAIWTVEQTRGRAGQFVIERAVDAALAATT